MQFVDLFKANTTMFTPLGFDWGVSYEPLPFAKAGNLWLAIEQGLQTNHGCEPIDRSEKGHIGRAIDEFMEDATRKPLRGESICTITLQVWSDSA